MWIHLVILILSVVTLILSLVNFRYIFTLYNKLQKKIPKDIRSILEFNTMEKIENYISNANELNKTKEQISQAGGKVSSIEVPEYLKEMKLAQGKFDKKTSKKIISEWDFTELAANIFQFTGSSLLLMNVPKTVIVGAAIGLGSFFSWINIIQYLRYNRKYYVFFRAIVKSFPSILKLVVGMIPLFVGYAFIGTAIFWQVHKFEDINRTMQSLFGMVNADGIFFIFNEITKINYWLGQIYLYSFIFIFIYLVQNLFLQVVYKVYAMDTKDMKDERKFTLEDDSMDKKINFDEKKKDVIMLSNIDNSNLKENQKLS